MEDIVVNWTAAVIGKQEWERLHNARPYL